ncbi:MAG: dicarboxylate/amino acid:cation symporter [Lachnospiraceae bacterium]|nr:dicarboxylate/amino acid:cation symporter [Lachnospiraceae bacterium]
MKKVFSAEQVAEILLFITENTRRHKLKKSEENRAILMSEETLMTMLKHTTGDEVIVYMSYLGGNLKIRMIARGEAFDPLAADASEPMRAALMQSFSRDIRVRNQKGTNVVTISAYKSRYLLIYKLIGAGLLGLILSLLLRAVCPSEACRWIASNIMNTGKTIFMNCLNMLIPPLVFFSIANAIVSFGNTSQLGRIGGKLLGLYGTTTVCATAFGFIMVEIIKPYRYGSLALPAADASLAGMDISFRDSLIKIIPDNIVKAFLEADTIQIIFLAIIIGLGVTIVGAKAKAFQDFIIAGNEVFLRITNALVGFMPLLIFCIIGESILKGGAGENRMGKPILVGIVAYLLTIVVMVVFYHLLLRFLGRLKPLTFTKKYLPYILQIAGTGASGAAIPMNMKIADELGIDKKVYSLSIPLGATVNTDGTAIYMAVFGLLLARLYGIPMSLPVYLTMAFAIIMLSAGAPPVVGSAMICLTALVRMLGLPVEESIAMVLGLEVFSGLLRIANNSIGDMVGSLIVASQEGLLDKKKYYSK